MSKEFIHTKAAPLAIGTYSQAVRAGNMVYLSGQIGLDPITMKLVDGVEPQLRQIFKNIQVVAIASRGSLKSVVKLSIFLQDMADFREVNEVMTQFFSEPYPARSVLAVKELPKQALVEVEAILYVE
jgi:reactive intermediate/imine deaminase